MNTIKTLTSVAVRAAALLTMVAVTASCNAGSGAPPKQSAAPRPTDSSPQPAAQTVQPQWPRASSIDAGARSTLPAPALLSLQDSSVPVFVPNDRAILQRSHATTAPDQYTLTSKMPDVTVSIQAATAPAAPTAQSGRAEQTIRPAPRTRVGNRDVFFTENEGIRVAAWSENGVNYSAEVECAKRGDPKCRNNAYLITLIERLVFVGGKGARVP